MGRGSSFACYRIGVVLQLRRAVLCHPLAERYQVTHRPRRFSLYLSRVVFGYASPSGVRLHLGLAAFVVDGVGTGFRPSSFLLDRQRRLHCDDVVLLSLASTSSRDTSLPGGGQSQSLVRLSAENGVGSSVGFLQTGPRRSHEKLQNISTVRNKYVQLLAVPHW